MAQDSFENDAAARVAAQPAAASEPVTNLRVARPADQRSEYRPSHPQEAFIVPLLRERITGLLAEHAPRTGGVARALDVGCGRQPFRAVLEENGFTYTGIDVQQNVDNTVDHVFAIDGAVPAEFAGASSQYQFVLCTEVLEHLADWQRAFANIAALTADGGLLLITCPFFYPLHEEPYDYWRPTVHTVRHFAAQFGFRVRHEETAGNAWDVIGTALATLSPARTENGFRDKVLLKVVKAATARLLNLLLSRDFRRRITPGGSLYISNVVLLERTRSGDASPAKGL